MTEFDLATDSNHVSYAKYAGPSYLPDACILDDGAGGFLLVCSFYNKPWRVLVSRDNVWRDMAWTKTSQSCGHLCYVPKHSCFYFVARGQSELEMAKFKLEPLDTLKQLLSFQN